MPLLRDKRLMFLLEFLKSIKEQNSYNLEFNKKITELRSELGNNKLRVQQKSYEVMTLDDIEVNPEDPPNLVHIFSLYSYLLKLDSNQFNDNNTIKSAIIKIQTQEKTERKQELDNLASNPPPSEKELKNRNAFKFLFNILQHIPSTHLNQTPFNKIVYHCFYYNENFSYDKLYHEFFDYLEKITPSLQKNDIALSQFRSLALISFPTKNKILNANKIKENKELSSQQVHEIIEDMLSTISGIYTNPDNNFSMQLQLITLNNKDKIAECLQKSVQEVLGLTDEDISINDMEGCEIISSMYIDPPTRTTSAQLQAILFHFTKFELPQHISNSLRDNFDFTFLDDIDGDRTGSAYFQLMNSIQNTTQTPLTKKQFFDILFPSNTTLKSSAFNQQMTILSNAISYIKHERTPEWLTQCQNNLTQDPYYKLRLYILELNARPNEYKGIFNCGVSKTLKLAAANALLKFIDESTPFNKDTHLKALEDGNLNKIYNELVKSNSKLSLSPIQKKSRCCGLF